LRGIVPVDPLLNLDRLEGVESGWIENLIPEFFFSSDRIQRESRPYLERVELVCLSAAEQARLDVPQKYISFLFDP